MALNHRGIGLVLGFNILFFILLYVGFNKWGLHGALAIVFTALFLSFNLYILYESYNYLQDCNEHTILPVIAFGMSAVLMIVIVVFIAILIIAAASGASGGKGK